MLDLVGRRRWFYLVSFVVLLPGIISLLIPPALKAGIEFTSGTNFSVRFAEDVDSADLRDALADLGHPEARVQSTGKNEFLVRTKELTGAAAAPEVGPAKPGEREELELALSDRFGPMLDAEGNVSESPRFIEFTSVSASVSREIARNSAIAVAVAALAIFLYLWWSFRSVPSPFRYGAAAIIALLHDTLLVVGAFSIFGKLFGTEINTMFITGLLTVIGFSVHDTIVVFDRIRETVRRGESRDLPQCINESLLQTMSRSLNTSLTVIFAILALLLMGGETIRPFLWVLLIGIITGTYSSICIAAQVLVSWEEGDIPRLWRRLTGREALPAPSEG
jgi:preprotein translocase subunit SecF